MWYRFLPLRTIRFCRLVIERDADFSFDGRVAGNEPIIHHRACVDRGVAGRRRRETAGEATDRRHVAIRESVPPGISGWTVAALYSTRPHRSSAAARPAASGNKHGRRETGNNAVGWARVRATAAAGRIVVTKLVIIVPRSSGRHCRDVTVAHVRRRRRGWSRRRARISFVAAAAAATTTAAAAAFDLQLYVARASDVHWRRARLVARFWVVSLSATRVRRRRRVKCGTTECAPPSRRRLNAPRRPGVSAQTLHASAAIAPSMSQ